MKRKCKRVTSLLLTICMVLGLWCIPANAGKRETPTPAYSNAFHKDANTTFSSVSTAYGWDLNKNGKNNWKRMHWRGSILCMAPKNIWCSAARRDARSGVSTRSSALAFCQSVKRSRSLNTDASASLIVIRTNRLAPSYATWTDDSCGAGT